MSKDKASFGVFTDLAEAAGDEVEEFLRDAIAAMPLALSDIDLELSEEDEREQETA